MVSQSKLSNCMHAFAAGLEACELKHAVISPGSRNFPIIKALKQPNRKVRLHSIVDERSAGFAGIGMAQATNHPAMVCCTSGTAALNYYPAIAEAFYAKIPLLVVTADRPTESIDNWEGQAIRQKNVFQHHVVASINLEFPKSTADQFYNEASKAMQLAIENKGPVHINVAFQEPFYAPWEETSENDFVPKVSNPKPAKSIHLKEFEKELVNTRKVIWLNGASNHKTTLNYPKNLVVFSDVISSKNETISYWEGILLTITAQEQNLLPDLIITSGMYFLSKKLRQVLSSIPNLKHYHIGEEQDIPTPFKTKPVLLNHDLSVVLESLTMCYKTNDYFNRWKDMETSFEAKFNALKWERFSEFKVIKEMYQSLPPNTVLQIASSMPIRYVGYLKRRNDIIHFSNRGTSGIDGSTSTAVGYALAANQNVVLFTGDIAFLYDSNALWNSHFPENLKIVVFNNNGGGIFELIDGPSNHEEVLPFQTTDHSMDMQKLVEQYGLNYTLVQREESFKDSVEAFLSSKGAAVMEIQTDRIINKTFYKTFKSINNE